MRVILIIDDCCDLPTIIWQPEPRSTDLPSFSNWGSVCSNLASFEAFDHDMMWVWIKETFQAFIRRLAPLRNEPNPLTILSRAIGRVSRAVTLKQPRWRRGRWRAKT